MCILVTLAAALSGLGAAEGDGTVIWLNACEIPSDGIDVAAEGDYRVWVWMPETAKVALEVGGHAMEVEKRGKKEDRYSWVRGDAVALKAGKAAVSLGRRAAAIALSTHEGFNPDAAMGDMHIFDQPGAVRDLRAETVRHTDTIFTMPEFRSTEEWERFAARLRSRILLSSGLLPLPERNPLEANIFGRIEHDDYSVEKVHLEARPGFLVTGNLYRPVGEGPFPAVACPHGHWETGRLESVERGSIPGRCITLARMGMVAFSYDMEGYNDSLQFGAHAWVSDEQKLWGIHPFAVQLWSSIRVVDFLQSLPEVDDENIACTGASGGGTQTFALMAVDPRVKVAAPVNMISHSMQGGCICENAPIIRFDNSNMEVGALMAPRPLLMVSATGDWTRETPRIEYPAIRSIYALYGAEERVHNVHVDAGHNYNQASREAMYRFFGKWVLDKGGEYADFTEPPFEVEKTEHLRVFPDGKLPEGLPSGDEVIAQTREANRAKWAGILPQSPADVENFRAQYGDVLDLVIGASAPDANDLAPERVGFQERGDYVVERWILRRRCVHDAVPAILYRAASAEPQDAVLVVHGEGKAALADLASGGPGPLVAGLMAQGKAVMAIDAFLIGEHHHPQKKTVRRTQGSFSDTFQPTDTGCRIQDVLTALTYLRFRRDLTENISLIGLGEGGLWSLFAAAMDDGVRTAVIDGNGFDVTDDAAWVERFYMPCIRSVGDVATASALLAPRPLTVFNAAPALLEAAGARYAAAGAETSLAAQADDLDCEAIIARVRP